MSTCFLATIISFFFQVAPDKPSRRLHDIENQNFIGFDFRRKISVEARYCLGCEGFCSLGQNDGNIETMIERLGDRANESTGFPRLIPSTASRAGLRMFGSFRVFE